MIKVTLNTNAAAIIADFRAAQDAMPKAIASAINKMAAQVKTAASRYVRDAGYNMKASTIKKGIRIVRASSGSLTASVIASGRPIPLIEFGAVDMHPSGVAVKVLNGRKLIKDAFIVKLPNGKRAVCVRATNAKSKKVQRNGKAAWSGLPIRQLYGPALPDALVNKAVEKAVLALVAEKLPKILAHENDWLRKKLGT